MNTLREHNKLTLPAGFDLDGFERYLDEVWQSRHFCFDPEIEPEEAAKEQGFFTFHRNNEIKASQYVGFLQFKDLALTVYPKLFQQITAEQTTLFYQHLVYWLSYCRRINFPFNNVVADMDKVDDFPEALIYFFAKRSLLLLQSAPYHQFELVEDTLTTVKGRLLINRYINESIVSGNLHQLICEHEPHQFDNLLNRIIKAVTRTLLRWCRFKETWHLLEQILFLLEEASDVPVCPSDCDQVKLNPLFSDYQECLDMCRFFLSNDQIQQLGSQNDQFCFLLPMNYVFEDYLCGFIEDKFKARFKALYQFGDWLTDQRVFRIKNDLILKTPTNDLLLIIDTKYKIRQRDDAKKGISQNDLYQMLSYAVRHNCSKVLLLYPKTYTDTSAGIIDSFSVSSAMTTTPVHIYAVDLRVCSSNINGLDTLVYEQLDSILNDVLSAAPEK